MAPIEIIALLRRFGAVHAVRAIAASSEEGANPNLRRRRRVGHGSRVSLKGGPGTRYQTR